MQCEDIGPQMLEYLAGTLPDDTLAAIRVHLMQCESCRSEVEAAADLWHELGAAPRVRPDSTRMRARFDAALEGYMQGALEPRAAAPGAAAPTAVEPGTPLGAAAASARSWRPWMQAAAAAALLVIGVAAGRLVSMPPRTDPEIALLRQELRDTRQMVTLSLLQQQSASERLKGVSSSSQIEQPGGEVVSALIDTLRHDANVNVRLASVDALRRFGGRAAVRRSVVDALSQQESPLVQMALIDFIVETQGPDAVMVLRRLADDVMLDMNVRARARRGLEQVG